jgi:3-methyl-2-oxobutanoate hydroxymethyltransferase
VLVTHDLLGLFDRFTPKFVKRYAHFHAAMQSAFRNFMEDVQTRAFPAPEHSIEMPDEEWEAFLQNIENA